MLNPDFKNAQKLDLHSAMSIFVIMMGALFYLEAAPGTHTAMALLTVLCGVVWYAGHKTLFKYLHEH